jgi:predicted nucleotide-binding protein
MATVEMARPIEQVRAQIEKAKQEGESLLSAAPTQQSDISDFRARYLSWESRTAAVLEASFTVSGFMTSSPKDEFTGTAISLLDLKIAATTIPLERLPEVISDIREKIRVLDAIDDRLDVYQPIPSHQKDSSPDLANAPIFLVHGRDLARRETVRRFLETVTDRAVVVLAEQPNRGQDVLGKLLSHAQQAAFAVVLLTADDIGGLNGGELSPRARQNVVFELGLFIGLLGRDKVAALNESTVELPTDFSGVAYIPVNGESWAMELARELKAAGIEVSLDRAI